MAIKNSFPPEKVSKFWISVLTCDSWEWSEGKNRNCIMQGRFELERYIR